MQRFAVTVKLVGIIIIGIIITRVHAPGNYTFSSTCSEIKCMSSASVPHYQPEVTRDTFVTNSQVLINSKLVGSEECGSYSELSCFEATSK